ncbi:hypothetical protein C8R46DRAFT_1048504 [Mycena filopes]|nr:hypothetical protein C8R46DRAFT_1048504 [Mycena filopes]
MADTPGPCSRSSASAVILVLARTVPRQWTCGTIASPAAHCRSTNLSPRYSVLPTLDARKRRITDARVAMTGKAKTGHWSRGGRTSMRSNMYRTDLVLFEPCALRLRSGDSIVPSGHSSHTEAALHRLASSSRASTSSSDGAKGDCGGLSWMRRERGGGTTCIRTDERIVDDPSVVCDELSGLQTSSRVPGRMKHYRQLGNAMLSRVLRLDPDPRMWKRPCWTTRLGTLSSISVKVEDLPLVSRINIFELRSGITELQTPHFNHKVEPYSISSAFGITIGFFKEHHDRLKQGNGARSVYRRFQESNGCCSIQHRLSKVPVERSCPLWCSGYHFPALPEVPAFFCNRLDFLGRRSRHCLPASRNELNSIASSLVSVSHSQPLERLFPLDHHHLRSLLRRFFLLVHGTKVHRPGTTGSECIPPAPPSGCMCTRTEPPAANSEDCRQHAVAPASRPGNMVVADTCPGLFHQDKELPGSRGGLGCLRAALRRPRLPTGYSSACRVTGRRRRLEHIAASARAGVWGLCPYRPGLHLHHILFRNATSPPVFYARRLVTILVKTGRSATVPQQLLAIDYQEGKRGLCEVPMTDRWASFRSEPDGVDHGTPRSAEVVKGLRRQCGLDGVRLAAEELYDGDNAYQVRIHHQPDSIFGGVDCRGSGRKGVFEDYFVVRQSCG